MYANQSSANITNMHINGALAGKVCVIVGAAGLVGKEFSRECGRQGATVVVSDFDTAKGEALAKEIVNAGGTATHIPCDALDPTSVKIFAAEILKKFGKVDGMVNVVFPRTKAWGTRFTEISHADFLKHLEMQIAPSFLTAREFGEIMAKQGSGSIVLMGSLYATHAPRFEMYEGSPTPPPPAEYTIGKGGLVMLNKYLAKYYGPKGVRVNMLSPGGIWDNHSETFETNFGKHTPLGGHMQKSTDLPATLVYYFSEASGQVTGQNITIDGGWTL